MTEVPKIVHHRLRAATQARETLEQTHPDADLLAAFAEQALPASEREGVLQHLALCTDCRDVVALALLEVHNAIPPMEADAEVVVPHVAATPRKSRFSWAELSWAHLRWATLAAGIAVAILVVRPGMERTGNHATVNSAANRLSPPASEPQSATPTASSEVASTTHPAHSAATNVAGTNVGGTNVAGRDMAPRPLTKRAESAAGNVESKATKSALSARRPTAILSPEPEMQLAGNMASTRAGMKHSGEMKKDSVSAGNSSTTVEVAAGTSVVSTDEALGSEPTMMAQDGGLAVQNAPKIEKAKPALDERESRDAAVNGKVTESQMSAQKGLAPSAPARSQAEVAQLELTSKAPPALNGSTPSPKLQGQTATWKIANGVLQRSLDSGHTWQTAARATLALLCYASYGQEVWAGGQAGTLLHSADNGSTWSAVAVSFKSHALSSDVIHLNLESPARIVLSTGTHEIWSSADSGKTWEKK
ncbi:MAG: YCF48-related protein [Terriglobales bacterium]